MVCKELNVVRNVQKHAFLSSWGNLRLSSLSLTHRVEWFLLLHQCRTKSVPWLFECEGKKGTARRAVLNGESTGSRLWHLTLSEEVSCWNIKAFTPFCGVPMIRSHFSCQRLWLRRSGNVRWWCSLVFRAWESIVQYGTALYCTVIYDYVRLRR